MTNRLKPTNSVLDIPPVFPIRKQPGLMPPTVAGPMMPPAIRLSIGIHPKSERDLSLQVASDCCLPLPANVQAFQLFSLISIKHIKLAISSFQTLPAFNQVWCFSCTVSTTSFLETHQSFNAVEIKAKWPLQLASSYRYHFQLLDNFKHVQLAYALLLCDFDNVSCLLLWNTLAQEVIFIKSTNRFWQGGHGLNFNITCRISITRGHRHYLCNCKYVLPRQKRSLGNDGHGLEVGVVHCLEMATSWLMLIHCMLAYICIWITTGCNIIVVSTESKLWIKVCVIFRPPSLSHALIGRMRSSRKLKCWGASALPESRVEPYGRKSAARLWGPNLLCSGVDRHQNLRGFTMFHSESVSAIIFCLTSTRPDTKATWALPKRKARPLQYPNRISPWQLAHFPCMVANMPIMVVESTLIKQFDRPAT